MVQTHSSLMKNREFLNFSNVYCCQSLVANDKRKNKKFEKDEIVANPINLSTFRATFLFVVLFPVMLKNQSV